MHLPPVVIASVCPLQLPLAQGAPCGSNASAGRLPLAPSHTSATSQAPASGRHTTPDAAISSVGHAALDPEHLSATSHEPALGRHIAPGGARTSAGQTP